MLVFLARFCTGVMSAVPEQKVTRYFCSSVLDLRTRVVFFFPAQESRACAMCGAFSNLITRSLTVNALMRLFLKEFSLI